MERTAKTGLMALALVLALAAGALAQGPGMKPELWNGTHWQAFPPEVKVAYIKGMGNLADFEVGISGKERAGCIAAGFVDELRGKTIEGIVREVDKYYRDNPGKMSTSVIEVVLRQCTALCKPEAQGGPSKK